MRTRPYWHRLRASLAGASCAVLAGCAGIGGGAPDSLGPVLAGSVSMQQALRSVRAGQSKAEVAAALGKAAAVRFDSGAEVWVYRDPHSVGADGVPAEFVILFDRSGSVKKARVRPAGGAPAG